MEYRYMIWNDVRKCFQFPSICETTEKGANTLLFKFIGNDARKQRFEVKKVEKEKAYQIRQELRDENKARRIKQELENIPFNEILALVVRNRNSNDSQDRLDEIASNIALTMRISTGDVENRIKQFSSGQAIKVERNNNNYAR